MARPTASRTGVYRVRLTVPEPLRDTARALFGVRAEFIENLGTKDGDAARQRAPEALARLHEKLEAVKAAAAGKTPSLTARQVAYLAGTVYQREKARWHNDPGRAEQWRNAQWVLEDRLEAGPHPKNPNRPVWTFTPTAAALEEACSLAVAEGLLPGPRDAEKIAEAVWAARLDLYKLLEKRAEGDWSPDPNPARFPAMPVAQTSVSTPSSPRPGEKPTDGPAHATARAEVPIDSLLTGWAADREWKLDMQPLPRPLYDRMGTAERLAAFVGHRDAQRVTKADAVRWKEEMQAQGVGAKTIRNTLSEMSAIWKAAIRQGKIQGENPSEGISPPKPKRLKTVRRPYTDEEATTILTAARAQAGMLRWLPWLCCLTGARLAEAVQGVREDVAEIDGVWTLRIHADGDDDGAGGVRSVKNEASIRTIPLHPALIAEGFLAYVQSLPAGSPLFPDVEPDKRFGLRATNAGKKMGRWLRDNLKITDPATGPAHSWRHWFIDAARKAQIHPEVRSALTGHSAKLDESAGYGDGMGSFISILAGAMAKVKLPTGIASRQDDPLL